MLGRLVFAVFLLACGAVRGAQVQPDAGWHDSIKTMPDLRDVRLQLQVLVNIDGFQEDNRFCIVGWKGGDEAEVYWINEHQLILWEPQDNNHAIISSREWIDLRTGVMPDSPDYTGQYPMRSEVEGILYDCSKYGDNYNVKKSEDGWVPISEYKEFNNAKNQLQNLVNNQGHVKKNNLCVIGQVNNQYVAAYIYWPEEQRLIYWLPDQEDPFDPEALYVEFGDLDLKKVSETRKMETNLSTKCQRNTLIKYSIFATKKASILIFKNPIKREK
jgi:hypothetical protein